MDAILSIFASSAIWLFVCALIFTTLAFFFPNNREQKFFRKSLGVDTIYWFLQPLYGIFLGWVLAGLALTFIDSRQSADIFLSRGLGVFADFPIWAQMLVVLLISDVLQYFIHRLFHDKALWKIHAVHHSSVDVDWLSATRFHPLNLFVYTLSTGLPLFVLGFDPLAYILLGPVNLVLSALVHANLNWTFGPLRYLMASPVFHRWHHTATNEGGEKNFAPTFPFIDVLFGTFYMPKRELPKRFGVSEPVPVSFVGQLFYPLKK